MAMPRFNKARDANEPEIVLRLRQLGCNVFLLDEPCDLLIQCVCGRWHVAEVKNPSIVKTRKKGTEGRTEKQQRTMGMLHAPIPIVQTPDEAEELLCCAFFLSRRPRSVLE